MNLYKKVTNREKEILYLASLGFSQNQIASKAYISRYTVKDHIKSLKHKMDAANTAQLIRKGFECGFLQAAS